MERGEYDAVILAKAGLDRLGWSERITETFSPQVFLPAVGQGAITVECRLKDTEVTEMLAGLDDAETRTAIIAERALLAALLGGCQVPLLPGRSAVCKTASDSDSRASRRARGAHGQPTDGSRSAEYP